MKKQICMMMAAMMKNIRAKRETSREYLMKLM